jgi:hypothetical protein
MKEPKTQNTRLKIKSEKGVVLIMVIVLSAVALVIMTALIYMITVGTQISGLQKRYKTALEAGEGGEDVFYQLIATRAETAGQNALASELNAFGLNFATTTPVECTGLVSGSTASYSGLAAKLMTPSSLWSPECNSSISIDPATPSTYDMKVELGTTTKYTVYAKIVSTIDGNTGGDQNLAAPGVENANGGEVKMMAIPFLYAIEVVSENSAKVDERAKVSTLYQY